MVADEPQWMSSITERFEKGLVAVKSLSVDFAC